MRKETKPTATRATRRTLLKAGVLTGIVAVSVAMTAGTDQPALRALGLFTPRVEAVLDAHSNPETAQHLVDLGNRPGRHMGHPMIAYEPTADEGGLRGGDLLPPESPIVSGTFINFETPLVDPMALSDDGATLLAVHPANNSLLVLDTTGGLSRTQEIPVGLSPTTVRFQPGTNDETAWVLNMISDNISIVDLVQGTVVDLIDVGDEPVDLVFNPAGTFAFVVLQGSAIPDDGDPLIQEGMLLAIDTATLQIVDKVFLDQNSPRSIIYNPAQDHVVTAALRSGNNTTTVGLPIEFETILPMPNDPTPCELACSCDCATMPGLIAPQLFTPTATVFANPRLSPWPDIHVDEPNGFPPGPFVERVVTDGGHAPDPVYAPWQEIIDILTDANGDPDPAMVDQMNLELGITNAFDVITELTHDAKDTLDNDLVVVDVSDPAGAGLSVVNAVGGIGTILRDLAINPIGEIFVVNTEADTTTRLEPNLKGKIVDHRVTLVLNPQAPNPLVNVTDLHSGVPDFDNVDGPNLIAQASALSHPIAIEFNDDGSRAYGVAMGSGRLFVLDGLTTVTLGRADVGVSPAGLEVDSVAQLVYVMDRDDYCIYVVDVSDDANMQPIDRFCPFNPEPEVIQLGRQFLYNSRFANNFASSCHDCHTDGHLDGVAWDLGNPEAALQPPPPNLPGLNSHPLKGPMVTQSLRGLDRHFPLHWRGDKIEFIDFNGAFPDLLGAENKLPDEDMLAYQDFARTINYPPNPYRNRDNTFKDPLANAGGVLYGLTPGAGTCNRCHHSDHGGAQAGPDGDEGTVLVGEPLFMQLQIVTQLRGVNKKFRNDTYCGNGLIHDGREDREENDHPLQTFLLNFTNFNAQQRIETIAYFEAFATNVAPVVGWQFLVEPCVARAAEPPANPRGAHPQSLSKFCTIGGVIPAPLNDAINTMVAEFQLGRGDVVAKGIVGGQQRGYVLIAGDPAVLFQADDDSLITFAALINSLTGNDVLGFTAVPPGSGRRIGIDQDADGMSDGLDPFPQQNDDGDVNLSGTVDGLDLQPFIDVILDPAGATYEAFHTADVNNDDEVDMADLPVFVQLLLDGP